MNKLFERLIAQFTRYPLGLYVMFLLYGVISYFIGGNEGLLIFLGAITCLCVALDFIYGKTERENNELKERISELEQMMNKQINKS